MSPVRPLPAAASARRPRGLAISVLAGLVYLALPGADARAAVCYQLPFPNPNLADGWGSTCCGRTSPHRGVDFPQPSGTPVPAVADGTVVLNVWSGCLGNVVVVQHADGIFSSYNHLVVPSPLPPGTPVSIGQQVGQVGNTGSCSFGAHLHLNMSDHATGYGTGSSIDPYAYITQHLTCNDPPVGNLDDASCDAIWGWTQDPSDPGAALEAHIYFDGPAGDPKATSVPVTADVYRDDLCMAINSCRHGFRLPTPLSLHDGLTHAVHAYGLDSEGSGNNPQLGASPRSFTCPPPALDGVRRHIADNGVLTAWQFSTFSDLVTLDDTTVASYGTTIPLPFTPELAIADDGSNDLWLIDGEFGERRRFVANLEVAAAWRLDLGVVAVWPVAELAALAEAPPLRDRPVLIKGTGPDIYVLDDAIDPIPLGSDTGGDSHEGGDTPTTGPVDTSGAPAPDTTTAASSDGTDTAASDSDAGCGCRNHSDPTTPAWLAALGLWAVRPRRRRQSPA